MGIENIKEAVASARKFDLTKSYRGRTGDPDNAPGIALLKKINEYCNKKGFGAPFVFDKSGQRVNLNIEAVERFRDFLVRVNDDALRGQIITMRSADIGGVADQWGDATFEISMYELKTLLSSHTIHISDIMPAQFYIALSSAVMADDIDIKLLKQNSFENYSHLGTLAKYHPHLKSLLDDAKTDPTMYGFKDKKGVERICDYSLDQLATLVVPSFEILPLLGHDGKLLGRKANSEFKTMTAIGATDLGYYSENDYNKDLRYNSDKAEANFSMVEGMFRASLAAAGDKVFVTPDMGKSAFKGTPIFYWRALNKVLCKRDETALKSVMVVNAYIHNELYGSHFKEMLSSRQNIVDATDGCKDLEDVAASLLDKGEKVATCVRATPNNMFGRYFGRYAYIMDGTRDGAYTREEEFGRTTTYMLGFKQLSGVLREPARIFSVDKDGHVHPLQDLDRGFAQLMAEGRPLYTHDDGGKLRSLRRRLKSTIRETVERSKPQDTNVSQDHTERITSTIYGEMMLELDACEIGSSNSSKEDSTKTGMARAEQLKATCTQTENIEKVLKQDASGKSELDEQLSKFLLDTPAIYKEGFFERSGAMERIREIVRWILGKLGMARQTIDKIADPSVSSVQKDIAVKIRSVANTVNVEKPKGPEL